MRVGRPRYPQFGQEIPLACSTEQIYADYPMRGQLLTFDEEDGRYKFLRMLERPMKLSELSKSGTLRPGQYQLITRDDHGEPLELYFEAADNRKQRPAEAAPAQSPVDIEKLRAAIKDEIRSDYDSLLRLYKTEADLSASRLAGLQADLANLHQQRATERLDLQDRHHQETTQLRAEIAELRNALAIQQLRTEFGSLQAADDDDEPGAGQVPEWLQGLQQVTPLLKDLLGSGTGQAAGQLAEAPPIQTDSLEEIPDMMPQFVQSIVGAAIQQMTQKADPSAAKTAKFLADQLALIEANGHRPAARDWVIIASHIAQEAVERQIPPERVAMVLNPLIDRLDAAKNMLTYMPAKVAADMLFAQFNLEPTPAIRKLVIQVLEVIKTRMAS